MRTVVTGAAGFIGSHLCQRLLTEGHEVTGLDSFSRFYARSLKEDNLAELHGSPRFDFVESTASPEGLAPALLGADAVCHLAGRPGVRGGAAQLFETANVRTSESVIRAAAAAGVGRVVLASSSAVYGSVERPVDEDVPLRPLSHYGRSKLRAERIASRLASRLGIDLVILRYFTVYGPRQRPDMAFSRFAAAALGVREMTLLGDGRQRRDFTYVGDACEATVRALAHGRSGATYNISGGSTATLSEAFGLLGEALGASATLASAPADAREPRTTAADLGRARTELGYEPGVTLAEGVALQAAHARAQLAAATCGS